MSPDKSEVSESRAKAGLTQSEAGALIHVSQRSWTHYEGGTRQMPAASWELFLLKTGQHPDYKLR